MDLIEKERHRLKRQAIVDKFNLNLRKRLRSAAIEKEKALKIKEFLRKMNFDETTRREMIDRLSKLTPDMIKKVLFHFN